MNYERMCKFLRLDLDACDAEIEGLKAAVAQLKKALTVANKGLDTRDEIIKELEEQIAVMQQAPKTSPRIEALQSRIFDLVAKNQELQDQMRRFLAW